MSDTPPSLVTGPDGHDRCWWCTSSPDYQQYHDEEWGQPVTDDAKLFERICLEGFQSGLSWLTILRKRDNFRRAFAGFDFHKIAQFNSSDVQRLLGDAGIVRHRGKIESTINNAQRACAMVEREGSLLPFFLAHTARPVARPARLTRSVLASLSQSAESKALSKELKKRGWSFVGPTTLYALMQATGMVNDHLDGCWRREAVEDARRRVYS